MQKPYVQWIPLIDGDARAPQTEIDWIDAATFSMLFYKRYIVDGIKMQNAFEYARERTQTQKDYPNYWE